MRTIVVCKCKAKLRRRDGDVKLVEHVAGSCDGVLELSGGLRWVREGATCIIETTLAGFTSAAEGRVPSATCPGPQENKTAMMEQVARAVSLF